MLGHPGAVRVRRVDQKLVALQLLERALVAPQVDPVAVRVTDVADDVAGVLGGDLVPEGGPLLPGRRNRVTELVHQLLVDPEHHLRQVVLHAVLLAVDGALRGRRRRPLTEHVAGDEVLERGGELERLLRHPHRVVDLLAEDHVRPTFAGPVPQLDLRLQRRGAVAVTIVGNDIHVNVRMRLGIGLCHRQADRVDPDRQIVRTLTRFGSLLAAACRDRDHPRHGQRCEHGPPNQRDKDRGGADPFDSLIPLLSRTRSLRRGSVHDQASAFVCGAPRRPP